MSILVVYFGLDLFSVESNKKEYQTWNWLNLAKPSLIFLELELFLTQILLDPTLLEFEKNSNPFEPSKNHRI